MSSHCHDESHNHDHNHGAGGHDHSDDLTPALQTLLYQQIDFDGITTLNESAPHFGRAIVKKTWAERHDSSPELESDADEQLLMYIPFTGSVKLHSVLVRTTPSPTAPQTLKVFANRDDLDFSAASSEQPTQTVHVSQTSEVQEIPLKRALFGGTQSLTLFFEDNHSHGEEEVTRISYLGFKGEFMRLNREPVNVLYEAAANPSDHKNIVGTANAMGGGIDGGGRDGI
ncbi:MAG: hypothetical protein M1812_007264 [Candelaria pacifica]|nr:MAG: hypothetical protein M1812_007264 [Candelaria pacifica]